MAESSTESGAEAEASAAAAEEVVVTADEARSWVGRPLDEMAGATVGRLDGALVDVHTGNPEWLVVKTGRLGARSLVPARHAVGAAGKVWVPFTRDEIRSAPRGDGAKGLARADEQRLLDHYGIGTADAGRSGEIAAHEEAEIT